MKTVVITGVSRGIGKALAEKFLASGDFVIGTSTTGRADWAHENLKLLQLDLADSQSIKRCVGEIREAGKKIDILVNNAAIWLGPENVQTMNADLIRRVLEVNVIGTADFTEQLLPLINKGAHILNVSSRAGSMDWTHHANYPDYKISKAGLNMITRMLSIRLKDVAAVSSVHPGWVKTDMGGMDADIEPAEAAEEIHKLATSKVETGQFWWKGEKFPW